MDSDGQRQREKERDDDVPCNFVLDPIEESADPWNASIVNELAMWTRRIETNEEENEDAIKDTAGEKERKRFTR